MRHQANILQHFFLGDDYQNYPGWNTWNEWSKCEEGQSERANWKSHLINIQFEFLLSDADTLDRIPSGGDYRIGEDYQNADANANAVANANGNGNGNGNANANANAIANANANAGHRGDNDTKYFSKTQVSLIFLTH